MRQASEPVTWRVETRRGRLHLVSDRGGVVWRGSREEGLRWLHRFAVAEASLAQLDVVTRRLLSHEKAQPAYAPREQRLGSTSFAIIADALPPLSAVARCQKRLN